MLLKLLGHLAFIAALALIAAGVGLVIQLVRGKRRWVGGRARTLLLGAVLIVLGAASLRWSLTT